MLHFPRFLQFAFVLTLTGASAPADDAALKADIAAQVKAARAILDPWHAADPQPAERYLHIVAWTPSDRDPPTDYEGRLTRIMEHIQVFYAKEMERLGFGKRSIKLQFDGEKKLVIHLVKGAEPFLNYENASGQKIRNECLPTLKEAGIDPDRETIVLFCNLATWDDEKKTFTHRSPYYAGGTARGGNAWQLDSPELDTTNLPLKEPLIQDGQYGRISLGKHNSIFIGGIAHELGHALGLPHNRERPDERAAFGTALMGSGNRSYGDELRGEGRGSFLTLSHGLRLASHPQFSGSVKGLNRPVRSRFTEIEITPGDTFFTLSGKVETDTPVYGVVGYMDPDGGSDYDATGTTAVPDGAGRFTLRCGALAPGKDAALNIVACHVNGSVSRYSIRYSVGKDGSPNLLTAQTQLALAPLVAALQADDNDGVAGAMAKLEKGDDAAKRISARLIAAGNPSRPLPAPAEISDGSDSVPLSDTTPASAKVGWGRPLYDRTPPPPILLSAGGQIFEHGIYAHAPAAHEYSLKGKWKSLAGRCGIIDGQSGSTVFVITGDGKELWRSPLTKAGTLHRFDVPVEPVQVLTLSVEDAGDGNGNDWGLWLEPTLTR